MKIKELHLRNIASIERADIDFENDLNDSITGEPSPIFLISGDTGAGKSVILDGISMALYKKTPRIMDVKDRKDNNFTDEQGESVCIYSIEQYTRLGISYKDESYSLVVFEGNDGKTYQAKLELGFAKSRTKDADGNVVYRHSKPKWTVKVGDEDWTGKDTKETILKAVGLTFEQFGRMAMLAQGQFAAFLTGEKTERESILEQLTNTEHFTQYGDAIKSLFGKAKTAQKEAEAKFEAEKEHTLPAEQVAQYTKEYAELQAKEKIQKQQIDANDNKIQAVVQIEQALADKQKSEETLQGLEQLREGEDYKDKVQLVADWDATATERQRLTDMQETQAKLAEERKYEEQLLTTFQTLSSDLEARKDAVKADEESLAKEKAWLDERTDRDALYTKAGEIDLQLRQYQDKSSQLDKTVKALEDEKAKTQLLTAQAEAARKDAAEKADAVAKKQQDLDFVLVQQEVLMPETITKRLDEISKEKSALVHLTESIDNYNKQVNEASVLMKEIRADEEKLVQLKENLAAAQKTSDEAKKQYDEANNRLTTMNASLEDTLIVLRKRLVDTHETVCPLCGQELQTIHMEEEFRNILTPIEKEQEEKQCAYKSADEAYQAAKRAHDVLEGSTTAKISQQIVLLPRIKKSELDIRDEAQKASIAISGYFNPKNTMSAIESAMTYKNAEEESLKQKQAYAVSLQNKITALNKEKKPLDAEKAKADKLKSETENKLQNNAEAIKRLADDQNRQDDELKAQKVQIDERIGDFFANWLSDIDATKQTLSAEAREYMVNKESYAKHEANLAKAQTLVSTLQRSFDALLPSFPKYQKAERNEPYACRDIQQEWTRLNSKASEVKAHIGQYSTTIASCKQTLDDYYASTGKTEAYLLTIAKREGELDDARLLIKQTDERLKSCKDAIERDDNTVKENMQKLGAERPEDIPAKETLLQAKDELNAQHDETVGKMGSIKQKLDDNDRNIALREAAEKQLEAANVVYKKWDILNRHFGGTRFRTLVQTYVLRPLLNNANIYLEKITDRYKLTCSEDNEQLSILVHDLYNKGQVRSATILSGGERFMISLALSLALSSLNRPDMNVNILFIDEGFGTLDENNLNSVMSTLEKLQEIAGQSNRRVGIISHREELEERLPVKIMVRKRGEGRSIVQMKSE